MDLQSAYLRISTWHKATAFGGFLAKLESEGIDGWKFQLLAGVALSGVLDQCHDDVDLEQAMVVFIGRLQRGEVTNEQWTAAQLGMRLNVLEQETDHATAKRLLDKWTGVAPRWYDEPVGSNA